MAETLSVRVDGPAEILDRLAADLASSGIYVERVRSNSISSIAAEATVLLQFAKEALPIVSAVIAAAAVVAKSRSVKAQGVEIKGYSAKEVQKLLEQLDPNPPAKD